MNTKAAKYEWKTQISSQDDVKFTNNINFKKKAIWQLYKKGSFQVSIQVCLICK